jgi:hypothetical protein
MWHYIKEHGKAFWVGFTGSGIVWGNVLFIDATSIPYAFLAYILKLAGAVAIAFACGLATALASDFHKLIKKRYQKLKDAKQQKRNDRAA